ncbi:hypothetical protein D3C72_664670 [compost metagenome]
MLMTTSAVTACASNQIKTMIGRGTKDCFRWRVFSKVIIYGLYDKAKLVPFGVGDVD